MTRVIRRKVNFTGKDGKEHYNYNFYLVVGNGLVAIKPCFKEDARLLYFCSEEEE